MNGTLKTPTEELVRTACKTFDRDNFVIEQALTELFSRYPDNNHPPHVLLKVTALNALYSTQISMYSQTIPSVMDMVEHIHGYGSKIDSALAAALPTIVDRIATITVPKKQKRIYFSFATKYCSWHKPELYPICDARVKNYLGSLQRETGFSTEFEDYPGFLKVMTAFRKRYRLRSFSFKDIDKFLWLHG